MKRLRLYGAWCWTLLCIVGVVAAQDDVCPLLVQEALDSVDFNCTGVGRNQACYGHATLSADVVGNITFERVGDIGPVNQIERLALSALDTDAEQWGIALLQLQANIPDTLPGQNVTFLAYGNTSIENDTIEKPEDDLSGLLPDDVTERLQVAVSPSAQQLNVRSGPDTSFAVVGSLAPTDVASAVGRVEADDWVQVVLPSGGAGWVFADLLTPEGDLAALPVVDASSQVVQDAVIALDETVTGTVTSQNPEVVYTFVAEAGTVIDIEMAATAASDLDSLVRLVDESGTILAENDDFDGFDSRINAFVLPQTGVYTIVATRFANSPTVGQFELTLALSAGLNYNAPMQAFYFTSGIGTGACAEVPEDGIVLQTPGEAGIVRFSINEVLVDIGSTIVAQAVPATDDAEGEMSLRVLEGRIRVEAFGVARYVPAGYRVRIPVDADGVAIGPPSEPEPIDPASVETLPTILPALPEAITIADAADTDIAIAGDVEIELTWDNGADLDLFMVEPSGSTISYRNPSSFSGAQLSTDINADCEQSTAPFTETITWPTGQPRLGTYQLVVSEFANCGAGTANWTLTVTAGGVVLLEESGTGENVFSFER